MPKKVLIIDDSALMRRAISDIINSDDRLIVADTAVNGLHALEKLESGKQYDIMLVDIQMPEMNGVEFLREINKRKIRIPSLVVSSIASQNAVETIEALELGAFDFVRKPTTAMGLSFAEFQNEILQKVYLACGFGRYDDKPAMTRHVSPKAQKKDSVKAMEDKVSSMMKSLGKSPESQRQGASPAGKPGRGASSQTRQEPRTSTLRTAEKSLSQKPQQGVTPVRAAEKPLPSKSEDVPSARKPEKAAPTPAKPGSASPKDEKLPPKPGISPVKDEKYRVPVRAGERLTVIASSTGGPKALQSVIPLFPADYPYPVIVVQHMPTGFTASLAKRLDELSPLKVKEAEDGETPKPGTVYIAQGGKQCELVQKDFGKCVFSENDKPARGGLKPCADIFFESLVSTNYEEIHCAVLTGMGADGTKGLELVKKHRKVKVVAQDEASCVVYGMPRAVYLAGLTDFVVPLDDIASTMIKL